MSVLNLEPLVDLSVLPDAAEAAVNMYRGSISLASDRLLDVAAVVLGLYSRTLADQIDLSEAQAGGIPLPLPLNPRALRHHLRDVSRVLDGGQQGAN